MTTSGSFSFTITRNDIIRDAMLNIGKLDPVEAPTAQEVTDCAFKLNMLIKQWQGKADFAPGLKVWTRRRGHLFLSQTTGQYSVGPTGTGWTNDYVMTATTAAAAGGTNVINVAAATGIAATYHIGIELSSGNLFWTTVASVLGLAVTLTDNLPSGVGTSAHVFAFQTPAQQPIVVETALLRDDQGNDIPLRIMTVQDYDFLPAKVAVDNVSDPSAIYYEFQLGNSNLFTDVAGSEDVSKHIVLTYLETVQDVLQPSDNFEYPQEWFLALSWGLAKEITPMFHADWTQLMQDNFSRALSIAQHKDVEIVNRYFEPGESG